MSYADVDEYRARTKSKADDDVIEDLLDAGARYIDRRLGWCAGAFAPILAQSVVFWPRDPRRVLWLRDIEGAAWPLRSWTQIDVDYGGVGTPDRTWTPAGEGEWVLGEPASGLGRPYRALRIWESHRGATESVWPSDPGIVTVTGPWGWAATPHPIRELNVHVSRSMQDTQLGGAAAVVQALEAGVQLTDQSAMLWRRVEMEYSAGRMGRLGVVASGAGRRR